VSEFLQDLAVERRLLLERADQLSRIWQQAQDLAGGDASGGLLADDLARIRRDVERRRFTIGLFGLIKRGKSTLLNALLGSQLSPTHVTPETAVPVYVDYGPRPGATVHFASGEHLAVDPADVAEWTSQKHNAGNARGVTHLQWTYPSPLLRHGVRVVDTPGLDDAEADELYTQRTVQELEAADAGILVFLSPPTVSGTEMAFLRDVTGAQLRKTLLVANLYPQHYHDPETRAQVTDYVRRRITEVTGETDVRLHAICAEEAWQARRQDDEEAWRAAGGAALLRALEETIAENTGRQALARAEESLERTAQVARAAVDLRRQALSGGTASEQWDRVRAHQQRLADGDDGGLEKRLPDVFGMRVALEARVHNVFIGTRAAIGEARSVAELETVLGRFTREVEVVTEDAFRKLHGRLMELHARVTQEFDAGVTATLHDVGAMLPGMRGLPAAADTVTGTPSASDLTSIRGAAVGGLTAGGAGFALLGALLGPIGLVAGALVGWRLGSVVRHGRELRVLRTEIDEQLSVIADAVLEEFDRRIDDLVAAVRATVRQRRLGFAADLADTLGLFDRLGPDESARAEALATLDRLSVALDQVTGAARTIDIDAVRVPVAT
jgi:hypothetical protein